MFRWIFKRKYADTTIVFWGTFGNQVFNKKIRMEISEIKPFKQTFGGIRNPPASHGFVSDAFEVHGDALDPDIEKKHIFFLVPEFEIEHFNLGDEVLLWISERGYCFKIEKVKQ